MRTWCGMITALALSAWWALPTCAQAGFALVGGLAHLVAEDQASELASALARVQQATASADWTVSQQVWTPMMLQKAAALLGEQKRGDQVARGWEEGRALTWVAKSRPDCQVGVAIIRFREVAEARAYLGLAVDLQRKQDELLGGDGTRLIDSRSSAPSLRGAEETASCNRRLQLPGSNAAVSVSQIWARVGNRIIEFSWNAMAVDTDWAQRVLDLIGSGSR